MGMPIVPPSHAVAIAHTKRAEPRFWVLRMHLLICAACLPIALMLPESHGPTILAKRARALRRQGQGNAFTQEELEPTTLGYFIQVHFLRPASEPFR